MIEIKKITKNGAEVPETSLPEGKSILSTAGKYLVFDSNEEFESYISGLGIKPTEQQEGWARIREERNRLLRETDHFMIEDHPTTKKQEWKAYRTALRAIPQTFQDYKLVVWPVKPE